MTDEAGRIRSWSTFLDSLAWYRDTGKATRRVERLTRQGSSPELWAATTTLMRLRKAPVAGYRRTRKARRLLDQIDGLT